MSDGLVCFACGRARQIVTEVLIGGGIRAHYTAYEACPCGSLGTGEEEIPWAGRLLSDDELVAHEALVRAAIRWADNPGAKVVPAFDLIMAELRRLRDRSVWPAPPR